MPNIKLPKPERKITNRLIANAHQVFYDTTGMPISILIDRAIRKILRLL